MPLRIAGFGAAPAAPRPSAAAAGAAPRSCTPAWRRLRRHRGDRRGRLHHRRRDVRRRHVGLRQRRRRRRHVDDLLRRRRRRRRRRLDLLDDRRGDRLLDHLHGLPREPRHHRPEDQRVEDDDERDPDQVPGRVSLLSCEIHGSSTPCPAARRAREKLLDELLAADDAELGHAEPLRGRRAPPRRRRTWRACRDGCAARAAGPRWRSTAASPRGRPDWAPTSAFQ